LQQVILNLCNNAAQAMSDCGRIELDVESIGVATTLPLSHGALSPGGYARISVRDSGRGIDAATLERLFEPFFTTRMTGSGLGLATAAQIVRDHGGEINVRSTVGSGSRFEVWLPRIVANDPEPHGGVAALPLGCGETVLIVEDDAKLLLKDEELLAALGYEPVGRTYSADVQALFREEPERFDAVILGHIAPATAALALAGALHEIASHRPILLAAASTDDLDAKALSASGISDVVHWPIVTAELAEALRASVSHGA
jgi:CheY-like chemotaxis protein